MAKDYELIKGLHDRLYKALRELETSVSKLNTERLYEVYHTNADLEQLNLVWQGFDRDIAESFMVRRFKESFYSQDFMLYNHTAQEPLCLLFSEHTKRLRGECQG
jgi:hypothetical protein